MVDEIFELIKGEEKRQREGLEMIPSENYVSTAVREAVGSVLENKYAEGYPGKRYYTGNEFVDKIENLCQERAKKLFKVPFINVQPHSGAEANLELYGAICKTTSCEVVALSQDISHGGHLSMGQTASFTSKFYKTEHYHLDKNGEVDWEELEMLAKKFKPQIIWSGGTGFTKIFKWEKYAKIADEVGAFFVADISHIAGLVVGGAHPSPVPFAHVIMMTTHKTLRGPRGAMIMVTEKGLQKDPELGEKINKSVFPGHQGGPHMNKIAGIAVALGEANTSEFKTYAKQIVKNAKVLGDLLGFPTENHMIIMDLTDKKIEGWHAHITLEAVNIFGNKQTIPNDPRKPYYPSGFRLGTPAITTRGMKEPEMKIIAGFINEGIEIAQELICEDRKEFKQRVFKSLKVKSLKNKVINFSQKWPTP